MAGRKPRVTGDEQAGVSPLRPRRGSAPPLRPPGTHPRRGDTPAERAIRERATALVTAMWETPRCPPHLRQEAFASQMLAWGRAEAVASVAYDRMCELLAEQGPDAIFGMKPGIMRAMSEVWMGLERHASQQRSKLGLDPVSYAKISRDLGIAAGAAEDRLTKMAKQGSEIVQRRLGLPAPEEG